MEKSVFNPKLFKVGPQRPTSSFNGIAIVGDIPYVDEAMSGQIWNSSDGGLLRGLMKVAGIDPAATLFVNMFKERPPHDAINNFYDRKHQLKPEWAPDVAECVALLREFTPRMIIALGPHAANLLLGIESIQKYRGTVHMCTLGGLEKCKGMVTYHPRTIRAQFKYRATTGKDLVKALVESKTEGLVYPEREIWIRPTIQDLYDYEAQYMQDMDLLTIDIETDYPRSRLITCIGFAPDTRSALVVPFMDTGKRDFLYWRNVEDHKRAHMWCKRWIESPVAKLGQNVLFDIQYLQHEWGCKMMGPIKDTMLLSHALQPELDRSLAYLSSTYTNEQSFKTLVKFTKSGADLGKTNKEGR